MVVCEHHLVWLSIAPISHLFNSNHKTVVLTIVFRILGLEDAFIPELRRIEPIPSMSEANLARLQRRRQAMEEERRAAKMTKPGDQQHNNEYAVSRVYISICNTVVVICWMDDDESFLGAVSAALQYYIEMRTEHHWPTKASLIQIGYVILLKRCSLSLLLWAYERTTEPNDHIRWLVRCSITSQPRHSIHMKKSPKILFFPKAHYDAKQKATKSFSTKVDQ